MSDPREPIGEPVEEPTPVADVAHIRRLARMGVTGVISNDPRLFAST